MTTNVADSTVWKDCLEALRAAIHERHRVHVEKKMWVVVKPSATPRLGFSANASAWTTTLRIAKATLESNGYQLPAINDSESGKLLKVSLVDSVRFLNDSIKVRRDKR